MSLVSVQEAPVRVTEAIQRASRQTGTDFSYLLRTAARESNFNHTAKAKTSSAAGLFQFIENTWLETMKAAGEKFGLGKYADNIFKTSTGRYYVPNKALRNEILKLRHDPEISAVLAGAFTQQNAEFIESKIGRQPTQGELYIGHFMGARGGAHLIDLAMNRPGERADQHFPQAARANRSIFYAKGRPRSLAEVYRVLVAKHDAKQVAGAQVAELPQRNPNVAGELEAVSSEPIKAAPLPLRKLALGAAPSTEIPKGSVGQWVTIVQNADGSPSAPVALRPSITPSVAGWRQSLESRPGRELARVAERSVPEPVRAPRRAEPLRKARSQVPLRQAERPALAQDRDDRVFENFFEHLSLNG